MIQHHDRLEIFLPSAPGVEPWLLQELGHSFPELTDAAQMCLGGVSLRATHEQAVELCLTLRLALGVWWRAAYTPARHFDQLCAGLAKLDPTQLVGDARKVQLKITSKRSRLYHTKAIAERFVKSTGLQLQGGDEDPKLHLRIFRDRASLSVDLVGGLLVKRGWRLQTAKAPLRKDLAALLLQVSGWRPGAGLVDPCCGSGTLLIEAQRACQGLYPNGLRKLALAKLPAFAHALAAYTRRLDPMPAPRTGLWQPAPSNILGMDRNTGAIEIATANAQRAGVAGICWEKQSISASSEWALDPGSYVVCNPPYGRRVGQTRDLVRLFGDLGRCVIQAGASTRFACIAPAGPWIDALGFELRSRVQTDFGGIAVHVFGPPDVPGPGS